MRPPERPGLNAFFDARHVVFVGASRTPGRLGHTLARNLVSRGFEGRVDFVNPKGGFLFDRPLLPDFSAVKGAPDLAVLLVPAAATPDLVSQGADRGIRRFVIASGGFSETGTAGQELESRLRLLAEDRALSIVGPNCVGLVDTGTGIDTSFLAGDSVPAGNVAFISHSGAICASMVEWARELGFGLSRMVSLGNQVGITETDALLAAAEDPRTQVICLYLESISDGRRFMEVCNRVTRIKPVVALKAGRSEAGRRAASSHTGALAGRDAAFDAAFRTAGVLRALSTEELVDRVRVLSRYGPRRARRLAILTNAGGPGVAAADAAVHSVVTPLSPGTAARLRNIMPEEGSTANPVDLLASASAQLYGEALRVLLAADEVDAVTVLLPPPPTYPASDAADALAAVCRSSDKAVVVACLGGAGVAEARDRLSRAGVPVFRFAEASVRALESLEAATHSADRPEEPFPRPRPHFMFPDQTHDGWLPASDAMAAIQAAGIPVPPFATVQHEDDVLDAARSVGFPVVLKADTARIVHKTDVGAVRLDVPEQDVPVAFRDLRSAVALAAGLDANRDVFVQRMMPPGTDLIVGVVRDAQFGALVMVGAGGVEVEAVADVAFAPAPMTERSARTLLEGTDAARHFRPSRGRPGLDDAGVVKAVVALAAFCHDHPQIVEVEINPLRVLSDGSVTALDARLRLA